MALTFWSLVLLGLFERSLGEPTETMAHHFVSSEAKGSNWLLF